MTLRIKLASVNDLRKMSPDDLAKQANILLYGTPHVLEEAEERQIFHRLYIPRNLNSPIIYQLPKKSSYFDRRKGQLVHLKCIQCDRPRHYNSGQRCAFCYRVNARLKFYDASEGADWMEKMGKGGFENGEHCGVQMPDTEWWDDTSMPTMPKTPVRLKWESGFRW